MIESVKSICVSESAHSLSPSDQASQDCSDSPEGESYSLRMTLKWFNASKGFGFLVPENVEHGSFDAFFHVTILQEVGLNSAGMGAVFECEIYGGEKGKQVRRITKIVDIGDTPMPLTPSVDENGLPVLGGLVKWYKPEKGFGFIIADDGQKDVFIHQTLLDKAEIETLHEGQRVKVSVKAVHKGREAASIELL